MTYRNRENTEKQKEEIKTLYNSTLEELTGKMPGAQQALQKYLLDKYSLLVFFNANIYIA